MRWLVSGANRGIGLELARQLARRGEDVVATARDPEAATALRALADQHPKVRVLRCDVTRAKDRAALADALDGEGLDVLILNAGVFNDRGALADLDLEAARKTIEVNALAPLGLLVALLPALRRAAGALVGGGPQTPAARVVAISSGLGSISDNTSGGLHGYRMSKAALNMAIRSAAHDLASERFVCVAMSPGWVKTDMGGADASLDVETSVRNMLGRIDALRPSDNGTFLSHSGGTLPW